MILTNTGCSTAKSVLALDQEETPTLPIANPFGDFYDSSQHQENKNMIFRTKKGDSTVEVEIPSQNREMSDFSIPISPQFKDQKRGLASYADSEEGIVDETYQNRKPSFSDREWVNSQPAGSLEDYKNRKDIESGLGLMPSQQNSDKEPSYLAAVDKIKQLYRMGRYEAALIEIDAVLVHYQTDFKLYEMRGTLFDRLGKQDLALKSWNQALRFDPNNKRLRKFLEKRQKVTGTTSAGGAP